jgi:hypothetical protein
MILERFEIKLKNYKVSDSEKYESVVWCKQVVVFELSAEAVAVRSKL